MRGETYPIGRTSPKMSFFQSHLPVLCGYNFLRSSFSLFSFKFFSFFSYIVLYSFFFHSYPPFFFCFLLSFLTFFLLLPGLSSFLEPQSTFFSIFSPSSFYCICFLSVPRVFLPGMFQEPFLHLRYKIKNQYQLTEM